MDRRRLRVMMDIAAWSMALHAGWERFMIAGRAVDAFTMVLALLAGVVVPAVVHADGGEVRRVLSPDALAAAEHRVVPVDETGVDLGKIKLEQVWQGNTCRSRVINTGSNAVRIREIVLFGGRHQWSSDTRLYGEGFTMLSQTGGTLGKPTDLGSFTDRAHYRIPQPAAATTVSWGATAFETSRNRT